MLTRGIPKVQTSTMPNLRNVSLAMHETVCSRMFPNVPCSMLDQFWKFHENPFARLSIMLLTNKQMNQKWWKHNLRQSVEVNTCIQYPSMIWTITEFIIKHKARQIYQHKDHIVYVGFGLCNWLLGVYFWVVGECLQPIFATSAL